MAAVVRWKAQHKGCAIGALCLLLIVASQIARISPLSRSVFSAHEHAKNGQALFESNQEVRGGGEERFSNGAPFIQYSTSNNSSSGDASSRRDTQSFARNLRWQEQQQPMQVGDSASLLLSQGVAGPFGFFTDDEMQLLPKIIRDWDGLKIQMHNRLIDAGFQGPSDRTCFLWLEDCYKLGKHNGILKIVEGILGDPLLLYGMSVWNAPPRSRQAMKVKFEGFQCETVDVLINSGLRMIQNSHKMTERMALKIASQMRAVARFYGNGNPERVDSVAMLHLSNNIAGVEVREMDSGASGEAYVIDGRVMYSTLNPTDRARTSMLLQFASANCTLRDQRPDDSYSGLVSRPVLPPTLLVSDSPGNRLAVTDVSRNDVREGLVPDVFVSSSKFVDTTDIRLLRTLPDSSITVFRKQVREADDGSSPGGYGVHRYGSARSSLLARITIEKLVALNQTSITFKSYAENQLVLVLRGALNHHHATKGYREVKELRTGDLAYLTKTELHALAAVPRAEYICIRWISNEGPSTLMSHGSRKSISNGKQLFEMPANDLGAINGRTIVLRSGQAYDPDNEADCDVVIVVLRGVHLQIIPSQEFLQYNEAVFIPAGEGCVLWNAGVMPVTIVALQLYRSSKKPVADDRDAYLVEAWYRTRGKVM